jgi:hypothetical protein
LISRRRARRYPGQVKVVWSNFWHANLADADGIFIFQLDKSMKNLEAKIKAERKGKVKIASHAFKLPGRKPSRKVGSVLLYEL